MVHGPTIPSLSPYYTYSAADQDRDAAREHEARVERAADDLGEAARSGAYVDVIDAWNDVGFAYRGYGVTLEEVMASDRHVLDGARWRPTPLVEGEIEVSDAR